ncbi:MAG: histidine phosphatase family protein [Pseudomonadota bacterium]
MTLRLILLRHAKSSWGDPALDDHDRPLNTRGQRDAPRIGQWLKANGFIPDLVLCSSAKRALETFACLGLNVECTTLPDLYMASPQTLLKSVRKASEDKILVIAHNPGIGSLAAQIVAQPPHHPRFHDYPTASTLVAEFDETDWRQIAPGSATVLTFVTPRDLPA